MQACLPSQMSGNAGPAERGYIMADLGMGSQAIMLASCRQNQVHRTDAKCCFYLTGNETEAID